MATLRKPAKKVMIADCFDTWYATLKLDFLTVLYSVTWALNQLKDFDKALIEKGE